MMKQNYMIKKDFYSTLKDEHITDITKYSLFFSISFSKKQQHHVWINGTPQ